MPVRPKRYCPSSANAVLLRALHDLAERDGDLAVARRHRQERPCVHGPVRGVELGHRLLGPVVRVVERRVEAAVERRSGPSSSKVS